MDFVEKNKKGFILATGLGLAGVGLYMLLKSGTTDVQTAVATHGDNHNNLASHSRVFHKNKDYLEMIGKIKKSLQMNQGRDLSKQILVATNQAIMELFRTDFLEIFQKIRANRRVHMDNLDKYAEEYFNGSYESEKLLEDSSMEVFTDLSLDPVLFEEQCERISQMDQNFPMFMLYLLESLKAQIPSKMTKKLTTEDLIEAFSYQITLLSQTDFSKFGDVNDENLVMLKQSYISDVTSIRFKFEEEDMARNPNLLSSSPKIMELHNILQSMLYQQ